MKIVFLMVMALMTAPAWAVPVVNENVANTGMLTIYPDHQDPHRFYIAPNVVMIARNGKNKPVFSYVEFRRNLFTKVGVMTMALVPAYTREEFEIAKAEILKKDPGAQFSGLPFIGSQLSLTGALPELFESNDCNHIGGLVGQEQACSLVLTSKGRRIFLNALAKKGLFTTLQFEYSVQAMVRKADGSLEDQLIRHGVAVRIDGAQLAGSAKPVQSLDIAPHLK